MNTFESKFSFLGHELLNEIQQFSAIQEFPAHVELVREGQYIKVVPIVLNGLVKVYTQFEDKELLLYYIQPDQSCIMSFSSCIQHEKSKIVAITEEPSEVMLMPADKVEAWIIKYPVLNRLFYQQYDLRYNEMIETIQQLLYFKLDKRLLEYLQGKVAVSGKNPVKISHKEIAQDLGTAREVVSRLLKKLEQRNLLRQLQDGIEIL
ncbi:MAG TPA: Crp/Fnr family transcriptional regulator [Chitinophagaceae bacterium]|nr:Crp/Fnr family transcriptional regulator [Chitinophagaceae bacterium]